jgi:hypothetical protein
MSAKFLMIVGLLLAFTGIGQPVLSSDLVDTDHGLHGGIVLVKILQALSGWDEPLNMGLVFPYLLLTAAYGVVVVLSVRWNEERQPIVLLSAALGLIILLQLVLTAMGIAYMTVDIVEERLRWESIRVVPSVGIYLTVLGLAAALGGLGWFWKEAALTEQKLVERRLLVVEGAVRTEKAL